MGNAPWPKCIASVAGERCAGEQVKGYGRCVACLSLVEFDEFVDALTDGSRLNLRGTTLTAERLDRVKVACRQRFGLALFDSARLGPDTSFAECVFQKQASFRDATFAGPASFRGASFDAGADLRDTHWHGTADLSATTFEELADLSHATFDGPADFTTIAFNHPDHGLDVSGACFAASATFHRANLTWVNFTGASLAHLRFTEVVHVGRLDLSSTVVTGDADFGGLTPTAVTTLGPFVVGGTVSFDGARFEKTIRILVSATRLHLRDVTPRPTWTAPFWAGR
jgi:uncharacterized protein YjbI with pentapeptide repeats